MSEHFGESSYKEINLLGQHISVVIQSGNQHINISGIFLGETEEHFIVKRSNNKIIYINKSKLLYHVIDMN
jgi:RNase P/RNase MRP subunit p29